MNEREWLNCTDPQAMLEFLLTSDKASQRKLRLFVVAVLRNGWPHPFLNEDGRRAVEIAEGYADELNTREEMVSAHRDALCWAEAMSSWDLAEHYAATYAAAACALDPGRAFVAAAAHDAAGRVVGEPATIAARLKEDRAPQCPLLRDIFGPLPLHPLPPLAPAVLAWQEARVVRLAHAAYQERQLPSGTLDTARLGVLADALEEAGCLDQDILSHLRGPGPHVRGCFALDLLLEKQ